MKTLNPGWQVRQNKVLYLMHGNSQLNEKSARCGAVPRLPYETRLFRVQADLILNRQKAGIWEIPGMRIVQQAVSGMTQAQIYNDQ